MAAPIVSAPLFITLEGPEGAGKTTQAELLRARLQQAGQRVTLTRDPGSTPLGLRLREVLLDPDLTIHALPEVLLYAASRAQLIDEVIRPALARGEIVICDRFTDSTYAYQGAGRGLPVQWLDWLTEQVTAGLSPHLTFLLDIDAAQGLKRAARRGAADRLEQADLAFHERVRGGFLSLARQHPQRIHLLSAQQSPEALAEQIWAQVRCALNGALN